MLNPSVYNVHGARTVGTVQRGPMGTGGFISTRGLCIVARPRQQYSRHEDGGQSPPYVIRSGMNVSENYVLLIYGFPQKP